jgi:PrgI family protein
MNARVPQDVDLEDRLIYGLSPVRFGYLVLAVLGALALWRLDSVSPWVRAVPCLLVLAVGAGLAWGRWRGRALDRWLIDLCVYVRRNHAVRLPGRPGPRRGRAVALPLRSISSIGGGGGT